MKREMKNRVNISSKEMASWINDIGENSLMLTISELHARCSTTKLDLNDLEPIVSDIINTANKMVFGKNKHFEFLKGIVVQEFGSKESNKNKYQNPHFHILFEKPETLDFKTFESKLLKVEEKYSDKDYGFYLTNTPLSEWKKGILVSPCYDRFVKITETHPNTGRYLTKSYKSRFFILNGRGINFKENEIKVYFDNEVKQKPSKGELFMQLARNFVLSKSLAGAS